MQTRQNKQKHSPGTGTPTPSSETTNRPQTSMDFPICTSRLQLGTALGRSVTESVPFIVADWTLKLATEVQRLACAATDTRTSALVW